MTQKLIPLIANEGRIINTSTMLTRSTSPSSGLYASAKGAVEVFTRYLVKDLGPRRIRANTIAPGAINTEFSGDTYVKNPGLKDMIASNTTLGRMGEASDIGPVVASLCSDEMGWITGQCIGICGSVL